MSPSTLLNMQQQRQLLFVVLISLRRQNSLRLVFAETRSLPRSLLNVLASKCICYEEFFAVKIYLQRRSLCCENVFAAKRSLLRNGIYSEEAGKMYLQRRGVCCKNVFASKCICSEDFFAAKIYLQRRGLYCEKVFASKRFLRRRGVCCVFASKTN